MEKKERGIFETMKFDKLSEPFTEAEHVMSCIYSALNEKGYNPINQIVCYLISGDPTYITSHKNARSLIMKIERDILLEEIVKFYLENNENIRS